MDGINYLQIIYMYTILYPLRASRTSTFLCPPGRGEEHVRHIIKSSGAMDRKVIWFVAVGVKKGQGKPHSTKCSIQKYEVLYFSGPYSVTEKCQVWNTSQLTKLNKRCVYKVCIILLLLESYREAGRQRVDCFHWFLSGLDFTSQLWKPQQKMS